MNTLNKQVFVGRRYVHGKYIWETHDLPIVLTIYLQKAKKIYKNSKSKKKKKNKKQSKIKK